MPTDLGQVPESADTADAPSGNLKRAPGNQGDMLRLLQAGSHSPWSIDSDNKLVALSTPLLLMVSCFDKDRHEGDVEALYAEIVRVIERIKHDAAGSGYSSDCIQKCSYVLCSFIDEAVMSTTWGRKSVWAELSLLAKLHQETSGGDNVFVILKELRVEPEQNRDLIFLVFMCLCLGFQGRYKFIPNGAQEWDALIVSLGEELQKIHDASQTGREDLSDNVLAKRSFGAGDLPFWVLISFFSVLLTSVYSLFAFSLGEQTSKIMSILDSVPL